MAVGESEPRYIGIILTNQKQSEGGILNLRPAGSVVWTPIRMGLFLRVSVSSSSSLSSSSSSSRCTSTVVIPLLNL
jgi:hypothetical protein